MTPSRSRVLPLSLACTALLVLAACQRAQAPATSAPAVAAPAVAAPEATTAPPSTPAAADGPVALKLTATDGSTLDLATHRGRWVVVNFWATWCHPCLAEMPALSELDQRRQDIDVVGLAFDDIAPDALVAFLKQHPVAYPIAQVSMDHPPAAFEPPAGLPTTYLLDPQGRIAKRFLGPITPQEIEQVVDAGTAAKS
ncbi:TlpA family protein disulfide reductase [Pseudoxanthomonas winnipegensis]|uniref:TlpA family protein disulfide reductase n=1 Tax=Pseudoxanthomonas winnipegensis TaxID=2480810 RepID=A0A4Q8M8Y4_9GAMM|nr:TlpA disulfide reductase family protein [Pseudoxanthomonas winnipegensis]TAA45471.1 TlpA family protein disulfide reductase [Pseudoxanthomonas winnipegensis]